MDEQIRTHGQMAMGIVCAGLSVPMAFFAAGALLSYLDQIWLVGILCVISFLLLFIGGLSKIITVRQQKRLNTQAISAMQQNPTSDHPEPAENSIRAESLLASWTFTQIEWDAFREAEQKTKAVETLIFVGVLGGLSPWFIHNFENESWMFSLVFGFAFSSLVFVTKFFLTRQRMAVGREASVSVKIDREKVLINNKPFFSARTKMAGGRENRTETRHINARDALWREDIQRKYK